MPKFAYYPGCSPKSSTTESDRSMRAVAKELDMELIELEAVACCGSRELRISNPRLSLVLNARTLALAEKENLDILTICNTCQLNLQEDNLKLINDKDLRREVNEILSRNGLNYRGTVKVFHFVWVLNHYWSLEALRKKVKVGLKGLRVAPFYGCHLLRPYKVLKIDNPFHPVSMRKTIEALGGECIDFKASFKCCGFHALMTNEKLAARMSGIFIKDAMSQGAECMVTPCPLCHVALDAYQEQAEKEIGEKLDMPIFHLQQLIGFALGFKEKELGLSTHAVSADKITTKIMGQGSLTNQPLEV